MLNLKYEFIVESLYSMCDRQGDNFETDAAYEELSARHENAMNIIVSSFAGSYCKCEHTGYWNSEDFTVWGITFEADPSDIDDDIQCLSIKDGCDYVRFEDGSYGIIAYYNGHDDILRYSIPTKEELKEWGF